MTDKAANVKRQPRATEKVAKLAGIPREQLEKADKVRKADPQLAEEVESGDIPLDTAAERAGVPRKKKNVKAANPQSAKLDTKPKPASSSKRISPSADGDFIIHDDIVSVRDLPDGTRVVTCPQVTVYHHTDHGDDVLVYTDREVWWFGPTTDAEHDSRPTRKQAESDAVDLMKSLTSTSR